MFLGKPGSLHHDRRKRVLDLPEIVGGEFDFSRSKVLLQTRQLSGTGDGNDPRLPGQ